jgi:hypothetical protein
LLGDQLDPASDGFLQLLDSVSAILGNAAIESKPGEGLAPANVQKKSIAVLPFRDMSASQEFSWLGDGVAEDLINGLTQFQISMYVHELIHLVFVTQSSASLK